MLLNKNLLKQCFIFYMPQKYTFITVFLYNIKVILKPNLKYTVNRFDKLNFKIKICSKKNWLWEEGGYLSR